MHFATKYFARGPRHSRLLHRHSLNLRLADMWLLPLAFNPPTALLAAAFSNLSSSTAAFAPVQTMGRLDALMKWVFVPSYPLLIVFIRLMPQSNFCCLLVVYFAVNFASEVLSVTQLIWVYFRGKKTLLLDLWDEGVDHFHARLPYSAALFAVAYFSYYCLWFMLPLSLIRGPMYAHARAIFSRIARAIFSRIARAIFSRIARAIFSRIARAIFSRIARAIFSCIARAIFSRIARAI
jgi:hypothetical protein